jgi:site-specific DNA-methyltransferase (adenine-specific)
MKVDYIEQGDCLELMKELPDKSIDMILCDLPYGTTQNKWDSVIPLDKLWERYGRIIKANGMICLTSSEPFTNQLINSKPKQFKYYDLVWDKVSTTGFLNAKRQPLRRHEQILCFYKKQTTYNPIMEVRGKPRNKGSYNKRQGDGDMCYGKFENVESFNNEYYPTSVIQVSNAVQKGKVHPTQKPVALLEYLIKTYTNEGEIVLDNCMGSGSTCVAAINTKRHYIGFELEEKYFEIAKKRIESEE